MMGSQQTVVPPPGWPPYSGLLQGLGADDSHGVGWYEFNHQVSSSSSSCSLFSHRGGRVVHFQLPDSQQQPHSRSSCTVLLSPGVYLARVGLYRAPVAELSQVLTGLAAASCCLLNVTV
jgi:hypothetical protein